MGSVRNTRDIPRLRKIQNTQERHHRSKQLLRMAADVGLTQTYMLKEKSVCMLHSSNSTCTAD